MISSNLPNLKSCIILFLSACASAYPMDYPLTEKAYQGQVQLCPPDQLTSDTSHTTIPRPALQVSMGIVSVFERKLWGSLNYGDYGTGVTVTHQQANSICRQLGFTGAVVDSARTVGNYGQYNFTNCQQIKSR